MTSPGAYALLVTVVTGAGCATGYQDLELAPVGPPPQPAVSGSNGWLVVYSAFDIHADFDGLPDRLRYSDYQLFTVDDRLLRFVSNDNATAFGGPQKINLPEDNYRVVTRANGYGRVAIPVVIVRQQVTTVHLEGGDAWRSGRPVAETDAVRLPDGRIVGWRAPANPTFPRQRSAAPPDSEQAAARRPWGDPVAAPNPL